MKKLLFIIIAVALEANAHGGRTNSQGCHNNRKTGDYHCHNSGYSKPSKNRLSGSYFSNCTEAKSAGAAPMRRGDPGYRPVLDRDNDGVACE